MWLTETEKGGEYDSYTVDGITFYKLKEESKSSGTRKRRYSDILKDPVFSQRNTNRKLNLIKNFRNKNGDLPKLIERWKELIGECVIVLSREYEIKASEIFSLFNLSQYGFDLEEYE